MKIYKDHYGGLHILNEEKPKEWAAALEWLDSGFLDGFQQDNGEDMGNGEFRLLVSLLTQARKDPEESAEQFLKELGYSGYGEEIWEECRDIVTYQVDQG